MKILAVDTSATAASVAVAEENKLIGEFSINTALTHSQTLIPMIDELLKNTGLSVNDIDAVAVNAGPGSFTGVRIGVAAVKGIAFPKNLPCVSVSTLESMAYNMLGNDCVVCSVMDARCSQVYNALFRVKGCTVTRMTDDRALSLTDLKNEFQNISEKVVLVGDGAVLCSEFLGSELENVMLAPFNNRIQTASSVAYAAFEKINNGETLTADELMPVYLRLPQAQRELNKKLGVK
ncbi:tRNA (adenosine(37)-N6)-threonylcarbamoyltransferase complex dimerization subunit type 1 TsaB [Ruminococcus sp.]|uniref:tRNA (adenosine(37)-N6)-threonylcarbamoyltransferase complex dimerization subunit type 1 TsaB n=1 Tax=Ruminococcus sp. TaxID=41978 RepID=UPI0025D0E073|nr:tRNA (adenosine(37)-N6)-threonylcarbamoyltransferase complex dimerization subunit type 1 TsaB [Ruminococcus sp.]MCI6615769.1 tRNA (adenosine(37)-N6)-threonylcarbamoyltransferase complex dimerization subunit type 1 TsaB [Ruminococcus sp.]